MKRYLNISSIVFLEVTMIKKNEIKNTCKTRSKIGVNMFHSSY